MCVRYAHAPSSQGDRRWSRHAPQPLPSVHCSQCLAWAAAPVSAARLPAGHRRRPRHHRHSVVRHHHRHRVRAIWPRCRPVLKSREWPCPRQLRPRRIPMRPRRAWTTVRLSAVWPATACGSQRRCPAGPGATARRQIARTGLANHMVRRPTILTSTPRCRPVPPRKASRCLRLTRRPLARLRPRCRNAWRPRVLRHRRGMADRADHAARRFQLLAATLQLE